MMMREGVGSGYYATLIDEGETFETFLRRERNGKRQSEAFTAMGNGCEVCLIWAYDLIFVTLHR